MKLNNDIYLSVVLPCRNEELAVGDCIEKVYKVFQDNQLLGEVIVSDSSTDSSPEIARRLRAKVIKHDRVGYGMAYLEAFKQVKGQIVIMGDADGTYDFSEIPNFLTKLDQGYDLVLGSRFAGNIQAGAMPFLHRYVGNPFIRLILRRLFGLQISEPSTGFVAIKKDQLDRLDLECPGMEFSSEFLVQAKKCGLKIGEIPINYGLRKGHPKLRTFRDGFRHLFFLIGRKIVDIR